MDVDRWVEVEEAATRLVRIAGRSALPGGGGDACPG